MAENEDQKPKLTKEERIDKEVEHLKTDLANGEFKTLRARVAFILSQFKETRNSDLELQLRYWDTFHSDTYKYGESVTPHQLKKMERLTNLARMRAKIQNEYEMYLADEGIRRGRWDRAETLTEETVLDKPLGLPATAVYCDETGKQSDYLGVGGLWFANAREAYKLSRFLDTWKKDNKVKAKEFHFTKLSQGLLPFAKEFFENALKFSGEFGFKAVFVKRQGLRHSLDDALREMHYQFLYRGIHHDHQTGRTSFPRTVTMFKDADPGYDKIHMQRLQDDITVSIEKRYGDDVRFKELFPVPSENSFLIQLADIFMASLNRVMERKTVDDPSHRLDEMADFVLGCLGIRHEEGKLKPKDNQDFVMIDFIQEQNIRETLNEYV